MMTIDWLVQTPAAHAGLRRGIPPAGLLSPAEIADHSRLRSLKRRQDRLMGRWTCKRLLQAVVAGHEGQVVPLAELEIRNDDSGAPVLHAAPVRGAYAFSISHARERAFCAILAHNGYSLGADMEYVQPRTTTFVRDYFTEDEVVLVERAPAQARPLMATMIWSAKEAVLKALRTGLRVDTRTVNCVVEPVMHGPRSWTPYTADLTDGRVAQGWWREEAGFVLTLAVMSA